MCIRDRRAREPARGGELPRAVHGREGHGQAGQPTALQGLNLPPRHPGLYDSGW